MPKKNQNLNEEVEIANTPTGVLVEEIEVEEVSYRKGQFIMDAEITRIEFFEKAEMVFKEKTAQNQLGKPVYQLTFTVAGEIPFGLGVGGNAIISKTTGKSKNSTLYKYQARYGHYPKLGDIIKVENNENGFWTLIL